MLTLIITKKDNNELVFNGVIESTYAKTIMTNIIAGLTGGHVRGISLLRLQKLDAVIEQLIKNQKAETKKHNLVLISHEEEL